MSQFSVIIAAAGSGTRFQSGNQKKTYALLAGKPLWLHSVERFAARDDVNQILIVVSPEDQEWFAETHADILAKNNSEVVAGGSERFESVENALVKIGADSEFVAVHDAARPCVSDAMLERVFAAARMNGNAIPAISVSSTLKRSSDGEKVDETVDRSGLYQSQTPQVFRVDDLKRAYTNRGEQQPTDEAQLMESQGNTVFLAEGCVLNRKVTSRQDLQFAESAISSLGNSTSLPIHFDGPLDDSKLR